MEPLPEPIPRQAVRESRGWLVALGALMAVLGVVAIFAAFAATLATVLVFGVLLLVAGLAQLVHALAFRSEDFGWDLVAAGVYSVVGALLIVDPVGGAVGLTLLLAAFFLLAGATRISLGLRVRRRRGPSGLYVGAGVLDLLLGVLIIAGWPETGAWVIGLFLGIELLFGGVALLVASASAGPAVTSGR